MKEIELLPSVLSHLKRFVWISLVIQWLRLDIAYAVCEGLVSGQEVSSHMPSHVVKRSNKQGKKIPSIKEK